MIQYIKFGQNPSFGSRDRVQISFFWSKSDIQNAGVTLKMRSRSPKSNQFFPMSHLKSWSYIIYCIKDSKVEDYLSTVVYIVTVWRNAPLRNSALFLCNTCYNISSLARIRHLVQEIGSLIWSFENFSYYRVVTLKIMLRSPESNKIFKPSQCNNTWRLATIRHLVQETGCRQAFFGQNLKISKCCCDREDEVKVTKIYSLFFFLRIMCLCKFGQNPPIGSGDRMQTMSIADADTNGIHTKSNMSPLPFGWGT